MRSEAACSFSSLLTWVQHHVIAAARSLELCQGCRGWLGASTLLLLSSLQLEVPWRASCEMRCHARTRYLRRSLSRRMKRKTFAFGFWKEGMSGGGALDSLQLCEGMALEFVRGNPLTCQLAS